MCPQKTLIFIFTIATIDDVEILFCKGIRLIISVAKLLLAAMRSKSLASSASFKECVEIPLVIVVFRVEVSVVVLVFVVVVEKVVVVVIVVAIVLKGVRAFGEELEFKKSVTSSLSLSSATNPRQIQRLVSVLLTGLNKRCLRALIVTPTAHWSIKA
ncbi:hypothetical protein FF38_07139 [Lucilia cuprina]|uniref:Uncharacterized protein n=1 Tax=Lucilia cuprina TaxID=7375 RepID=A0A0L0CGQ0_LUCCU|nr:hypothetical protein FF38_07139 [Lucilia cuprina]